MSLQRTCLQCGKTFNTLPYLVEQGNGKFCGQPCYRKYKKSLTLGERFLANTNKTESCWLWTGATSLGYGVICYQRKRMKAHRVSYELFIGPIPEGMSVLHRCDVPSCVNPKHLYVGTQVENGADMVNRNRSLYCGKHPRARLTERKVLDAWLLQYQGIGASEIARRLNVSRGAITSVFLGYNWKRVEPPPNPYQEQ